MRIAKRGGINIPNVEIRKAKDVEYLLIERYDREIKGNKVKRIHQEDFCQALGVMSNQKYQRDGGPNLEDCFELLTINETHGKDISVMAKIIMFNFLIGNNDAHAKNFSLLYTNRKPILAPAYDLLSTEVYPQLDKKMAMKIDTYDKDRITLHSFGKLCKSISCSFPMFKKKFLEMAETLPKNIEEEIKSLDQTIELDIPKKILEIAINNSEKIIDMLNT